MAQIQHSATAPAIEDSALRLVLSSTVVDAPKDWNLPWFSDFSRRGCWLNAKQNNLMGDSIPKFGYVPANEDSAHHLALSSNAVDAPKDWNLPWFADFSRRGCWLNAKQNNLMGDSIPKFGYVPANEDSALRLALSSTAVDAPKVWNPPWTTLERRLQSAAGGRVAHLAGL